MTEAVEVARPVTGLILSGGGARAAYQVGVLGAIADLLGESCRNPFPGGPGLLFPSVLA